MHIRLSLELSDDVCNYRNTCKNLIECSKMSAVEGDKLFDRCHGFGATLSSVPITNCDETNSDMLTLF